MNLAHMLKYLSITLIFIISITAVHASDDVNTEIIEYSMHNEDSIENNLTSHGDTIVVEPNSENPNQMVNPTIQPAIDSANPGDTIILKGSFAHCQFKINKTLNFIGDSATLGPCPLYQSEGSGSLGVFYITGAGSGSTFRGIDFINNAKAVTPFTFLIRGASNITISDCTINYDNENDYKFQGIVIENSNDVRLSNLLINNTLFGIKIINSSNIIICNSSILNGINQAISVVGNSHNINITGNVISGNRKWGIHLLSVNDVSVNNNRIASNGLANYDSGSGIYVNTNITKLIVKGNIFMNNGLHAIMYDYRTRNLNSDEGAEKLTIVDNNYFEGHSSMVLHHRIYVERDYGDLKYDAENDVFGSVGEGSYVEAKSYVYLLHAFIFNDIPCGFTYYTPDIPWTFDSPLNGGKYDLYLRLNLTQIKRGVYAFSFVDAEGNVAEDFNSFNITFILNDHSTSQISKKALIKDGIATVDFRDDYSSFESSDNVITAVFPGLSENADRNPSIKLKINDSDIPINPSTELIVSKLTTYPLSDEYYSAKLVDSKGNPIANQRISFKFNGKTCSANTNRNGIAKVKVSLVSEKTYPVTVSYLDSDDYNGCKKTSSIIVKTGSKKSKITAKSIKVKRNRKVTFQMKLTNSAGKALKNQQITVKLDGKTHLLKTNSKGIAKLSIKPAKAKKYKISMKFLGNANYGRSSKTATLTATK